MTKLSVLVLVLVFALASAFGQTPEVPKYTLTTEASFKGTVEEVRDRQCSMIGGMGSHLILRLPTGKTIEVHLASTKFVKMYDLVLKKGDSVEVVGIQVKFEDAETIFAREIIRGNETFTFRDNEGKPIW